MALIQYACTVIKGSVMPRCHDEYRMNTHFTYIHMQYALSTSFWLGKGRKHPFTEPCVYFSGASLLNLYCNMTRFLHQFNQQISKREFMSN